MGALSSKILHTQVVLFLHISLNLLLNTTHFYGNSARNSGGAIGCHQDNQIEIVGSNTFQNNSCKQNGGAMDFRRSQLNIVHGIAHFHFNEAGSGGAMYLYSTNTLFSGILTIMKNKAGFGGALFIVGLTLNVTGTTNATRLTLMDNSAGKGGGAMYVFRSNVTLGGTVTIENNTAAEIGGGIRTEESYIHVVGNCSLARNNAVHGGTLNTFNGRVSIQGPTQFTHNTADEHGGATYAEFTVIEILEEIDFSFNSAKRGGAMYFQQEASLKLYLHHVSRAPLLTSSFNKARENGGVIYHRDSPNTSQCSYLPVVGYAKLPNCFLQFHNFDHSPAIVSKNDSAVREGNFMFGGWMDRCKIPNYGTGRDILNNGAISIYPGYKATTREISSKPYTLCLCKFFHDKNCIDSNNYLKVAQVEVYRGQKFTVSLLANMQYGTTATIVTAITSSTARLETYQTSQPLPDYCAPLSYTVYSNKSIEEVVLYPDGPCRDSGFTVVIIYVTVLPCPDGFTQSGEICTCEDRLYDYPVNCTIADTPYITKTAGLDFLDGCLVC